MDLAAAISYYVLLSLFPALIVILAILGVFLQDGDLQRRIIESVITWIPSAGSEPNIVFTAIRQVTEVSGRATGGALAFLAWAASGMFGALRGAVNIAFHLQTSRPFLRRKVLDIAMILAMGVFFLLSVATTAMVQTMVRVGTEISSSHGAPVERVLGGGSILWRVAAFAAPFALSFVAFLTVYLILPDSRPTVRQVWPGAALAAVLFELSKIGFVYYVQWTGGYNVVFGALGAVAAFLFWVYIESMILLFGAEVAGACAETRPSLS
jgi:membrane protein